MTYNFTKKIYPKDFLYFRTETDLNCYLKLSTTWFSFQIQKNKKVKKKIFPKKFLIFFQK